MPYYYCQSHNEAWHQEDGQAQFRAHRNFKHKGETLPPAEESIVDEAPEGAKLNPHPSEQPWNKPKKRPTQRQDSPPPPRASSSTRVKGEEEDASEDTQKLSVLLRGIGASEQEISKIVTGYQNFSVVRDNPMNLHTFMSTHLPPKLHNNIPLVVGEMFGANAQAAVQDPSMLYYPQRGRHERAPTPPYYYDYPEDVQSPYGSPYSYRPLRPSVRSSDPPPTREAPASQEDSPVIKALAERVEALQNQLLAGEEERQREKAEAEAKERERVNEERFTSLENSIQGIARAITERDTQGLTVAAQAEKSELSKKIETLSGELHDTRLKQSQEATANLQTQLGALQTEISALRTTVAQGATGRTTEDLINTALPLAADKLESLGAGLKEELSGIRAAVTSGKLPTLLPNSSQTPMTATQQAEAIATKVAAENDLLAKVANKKRSPVQTPSTAESETRLQTPVG